MPLAAAGETHLVERQRLLRRRAEQIAAELGSRPEVQLVWLTGSVAKGLVDEASDLDLHVFVSTPLTDLSSWHYSPDSAPENIHQFPVDLLAEGLACVGDPETLSTWMATTCLTDGLNGAVCLYQKPSVQSLVDGVSALLEMRISQRYQDSVARRFVGLCSQITEKSRGALRAGATPDAHQFLRHATQELLLAHLISRGWIIRGAKKRPEIAKAYGLDEAQPKFISLFHAINGIDALDLKQATEICAERHAFRARFARHLRERADAGADQVAPAVLAEYEQHNLQAQDYYSPLLKQGIFRGPVNHIRSFSGFRRVPATAQRAASAPTAYPISAWLAAAPEADIIDRWLWIAQLSSSRRAVTEMVAQVEEYATAFNSA